MAPKVKKTTKRKTKTSDPQDDTASQCSQDESLHDEQALLEDEAGAGPDVGPDAGPSGADKKSRRKKTAINFTEEQEDIIIEWLKDHDIIYSKGSRMYKDTDKKNKLWNELASSMNVCG